MNDNASLRERIAAARLIDDSDPGENYAPLIRGGAHPHYSDEFIEGGGARLAPDRLVLAFLPPEDAEGTVDEVGSRSYAEFAARFHVTLADVRDGAAGNGYNEVEFTGNPARIDLVQEHRIAAVHGIELMAPESMPRFVVEFTETWRASVRVLDEVSADGTDFDPEDPRPDFGTGR